jgi:uncharacterized XkdX family phage protein
MLFKIVKMYYNRKIYFADDVKLFVKAGNLTEEQYKLITGEEYITI